MTSGLFSNADPIMGNVAQTLSNNALNRCPDSQYPLTTKFDKLTRPVTNAWFNLFSIIKTF